MNFKQIWLFQMRAWRINADYWNFLFLFYTKIFEHCLNQYYSRICVEVVVSIFAYFLHHWSYHTQNISQNKIFFTKVINKSPLHFNAVHKKTSLCQNRSSWKMSHLTLLDRLQKCSRTRRIIVLLCNTTMHMYSLF
jgi:hypothetical protein